MLDEPRSRRRRRAALAAGSIGALFAVASACGSGGMAAGGDDSVVWNVDNLQSIGGLPVTALGGPTVIETEAGAAVQFDGVDDALYVETHPLAGMARFTAEVIFRPDAGGATEQRFFHMQAADGQDRVMFEIRLTADGQWFLDTFIQSGSAGVTLLADGSLHPIGPWYRAAIVVDGTQMRHFVDGVEEKAADLAYQPQQAGRTSLGVRINMVNWYKGAIRKARFTPRPLAPAELLAP